jgi:hypothetical protein
VPEWFFRESCPLVNSSSSTSSPSSPSASSSSLKGSLEFYPFKTEVGTHQLTSVDIDPEQTLASLKDYWERYFPEEKPKVMETLRNWGVQVIYFDVTATAPLIAKELNIPSIAITNFSFDFIYSEYLLREEDEESSCSFSLSLSPSCVL